MDIVKTLERQLRARIPTCCLCNTSILGVKVYAAFSCLHVVCFACTGKDFRDRCTLCPGTTLVELDYARLEDIGKRLNDALSNQSNTDFISYSVAYDCFYELILLMATPEHLPVPRLLQIPILPLPPQPAAVNNPAEWEEAKGDMYGEERLAWPCGLAEERKCPECEAEPCICVTVSAASQLWDCWECKYAYNYMGSRECEKCGRVRRSERRRQRRNRQRW